MFRDYRDGGYIIRQVVVEVKLATHPPLGRDTVWCIYLVTPTGHAYTSPLVYPHLPHPCDPPRCWTQNIAPQHTPAALPHWTWRFCYVLGSTYANKLAQWATLIPFRAEPKLLMRKFGTLSPAGAMYFGCKQVLKPSANTSFVMCPLP